MLTELAALSIVLLLLCIGLVVKVLLQSRMVEHLQTSHQDLLIEFAALEQKALDQTALMEEKTQQAAQLEANNRALNEHYRHDQILIASLQTKLQAQEQLMNERLNDLQTSRKMLQEEFAQLADKVFIASQNTISQQNQESLQLILTPLKEQLDGFKTKVESLYIDEAKERSMLQKELKQLQELNTQMSSDALNLTQALKGENKVQGNWGEMVLERILEQSGLRAGREYLQEVVLKNTQGSIYRPDVIVKLPNDRDVIIDAKTSLKDYEAYSSTQEPQYLQKHIASIEGHIKALAQKRYEELEGVNTLDFILMFIPISNALMIALESKASLYEEAFKNRVVLVSPDTLLLSLKAIENAWRYEKQAKNAVEVTRLAQKLYDKVKSFVDDLDRVGVALQKAQKSYDDAYAKLYSGKDNMIRQIEVFKTKANIHPKEELSSELIERS